MTGPRMFNPTDPTYTEGGGHPQINKAGTFLCAVIVDGRRRNVNGKEYLGIMLLALRNLDNPDDTSVVNAEAWDQLYLNDTALFRVAEVCRATGITDVFDINKVGPDLDDNGSVRVMTLESAVISRAIEVTFTVEVVDGKRKARVAQGGFAYHTGTYSEEEYAKWDEMIQEAETRMVDYRKKRDAKKSGGGAGRFSGRGGASPHDDMPF